MLVGVVAAVASVATSLAVWKILTRRRKLTRLVVPSNTVVVDGANVAFHGGKGCKAKNLVLVLKELRRRGFDVKIVVDASLRHKIDKPSKLEKMIKKGIVIQAPPTAPADYFILRLAEDLGAPVVSNDMYRDWAKEFPWIKNPSRIVRYMICGRRVYFYPDIRPAKRQRRKKVIKARTEREEDRMRPPTVM